MKIQCLFEIIVLPFLLMYGMVANAEFLFKENFNGYYSYDINGKITKMTDPRNKKLNSGNLIFSQDVNTRVVDLDKIATYDTTGGLTNAGPISNLKITPADIPSRPGNIVHGALLFKYGIGTDQWAEERYTLSPAALNGRKGLSEVWVQFDIFCPSNYKDRLVPGHWGSKHFVFYADKYESDPTLIIGRVANSHEKNAGFFRGGWQIHDANKGGAYGFASRGGFDNEYKGPAIYNLKTDLGKWSRHTFHIKFPTSANSNNGIIEGWVRHANGVVEKQINVLNGNFWDSTGKNYINAGYILGWSNNGFTENTWFLVTNLIFAENAKDIDEKSIIYVAPPDPTMLKVK